MVAKKPFGSVLVTICKDLVQDFVANQEMLVWILNFRVHYIYSTSTSLRVPNWHPLGTIRHPLEGPGIYYTILY